MQQPHSLLFPGQALFDASARKPFTSARVRTYGKFSVGPSQTYRTVSAALPHMLCALHVVTAPQLLLCACIGASTLL